MTTTNKERPLTGQADISATFDFFEIVHWEKFAVWLEILYLGEKLKIKILMNNPNTRAELATFVLIPVESNLITILKNMKSS